MAAAPASVGAVPAKLKIRIKGLSVLGAKQKAQQQQVSTGLPNGLPADIGDQLADLHAAVEAFCQQGLRGLPGAVLLSPWREPSPVEQLAPWGEAFPPQEQQGNGFSLHAQHNQQQPLQEQQALQPLQQGQQPAQRRVRKRRAPDPQQHAGDGAAAEPQDPQHLAWGNLKRQRSNHQRAARDAAQLSTSIHSMLHAASGDAAAAPASPSVVSQPRAAGTAAGARSGGKVATAAGGQQPSRLQRSTSRLASPAPPAAAEPDAPAVQDYASPAVPAAAKPEAAAAQAMDVDEPPTAATAEPAPAPAGATAEPGGASKQQQGQQQELRQQQEFRPQQQLPQRQETKQEPQAEAKDMQQRQQQQQESGRKQQQVAKQEQQEPMVSSSAAAARATASQAEAEQPALVAAISEPAAPAAAAADLKPESPPSETSHQQHMPAPQQLQQQLLPFTAEQQPAAAGEQQHQQQEHESPAAPDLQVQQPIKQPEQTAVSRDRSQCSLPRGPDPPAGAAAVSMPAPAEAVPAAAPAAAGGSSSTAGAAGRSSGRLLELAPGAMTPAGRALAMLSAVPEVRQRVLPPEDRPVRTQEEAQAFLQTILDKAKQLKHQGDRRHNSLNGWDVFGLSFYALSSVEFLMYWDTLLRLLNKLRAANQPVDKLQQLVYSLSGGVNPFLRQTGNMSINGMSACNNCKGPDMAKMALRMLLERISAISHLRNLHNQRKQLEAHIRLLKSNGASYGGGSNSAAGSSVRSAAAPQQHQQGGQQAAVAQQQAARLQAHRAGAATTAAGAGKPPSPSGSSWSPAGAGAAQPHQQFNKRSPDDSNASNQDRVHLPVGGEHMSGVGGGAGAAAGGAAQGGQTERVLALAKSERALMDSMQELLKLTDSMHQTVMRIQQFLERPEVLASEHARAAALHISVLGLDAGMFSIPRVAAHTEAAVTCILKLLRSS